MQILAELCLKEKLYKIYYCFIQKTGGFFMKQCDIVKLNAKCLCCEERSSMENTFYCHTCVKLSLMDIEGRYSIGISSDSVERMTPFDLNRMCADDEVVAKIEKAIKSRTWRLPGGNDERLSFLDKLLGRERREVTKAS
jgi:hypothetical protein